MVLDTRLYDILTVPATASLDIITRSYKKMALRYHPDKTNHDPELTEKFKDATHAYEILRDPKTRRIYDAYGEKGLDGLMSQPLDQFKNSGRPGNGASGFNNPAFAFGQANQLFAQFFSDMNCAFGAGQTFAGFQTQFQQSTPDMTRYVSPAPPDPAVDVMEQGADIHHTVKVTLADVYGGKTSRFQLPRMTKCASCDGQGCFNPRTCRVCKGSGRVLIVMSNQFSRFEETTSCAPCRGTGTFYKPADRCAKCNDGYAMTNQIVKVNILPGMSDGDKIILEAMGDEGRNKIPGNLVFHVQVAPHSFLVRKYNDLYMEKSIDLRTALLGGSVVIEDFMNPGEDLKLYINAHGIGDLNDANDHKIGQGTIVGTIDPGMPKIVADMGMPVNTQVVGGQIVQTSNRPVQDVSKMKRGNLFVRFNVEMPQLSDFDENSLKMLAQVLPKSSQQNSNGHKVRDVHLSNLSDDPPVRSVSPSMEADADVAGDYLYDQIDIDSHDGSEENEDEDYYANQWASEGLKKRRKQNNGSPTPLVGHNVEVAAGI